MSTIHTRRRVTSLVGAIVMLLTASLAMAAGHDDGNRPIEVTFTKWVTTFPLMEGYWGDDLANKFVGEIFQRQVSQRQAENCYLPAPNCGRIIRLEALYEFHAGTVLFGWRVGAVVHVTFQTIPGTTGCVGAPWARRASRELSRSGALHGTERAADTTPRASFGGWVAQVAAQPVSARAT